jgi:hypothetical protein
MVRSIERAWGTASSASPGRVRLRRGRGARPRGTPGDVPRPAAERPARPGSALRATSGESAGRRPAGAPARVRPRSPERPPPQRRLSAIHPPPQPPSPPKAPCRRGGSSRPGCTSAAFCLASPTTASRRTQFQRSPSKGLTRGRPHEMPIVCSHLGARGGVDPARYRKGALHGSVSAYFR